MPKKLEGLAPRRKAAGMTQAQLAASIGVERAALAMWEIGASWPPARLLPALADVLICTIDELYAAPDAPDREILRCAQDDRRREAAP